MRCTIGEDQVSQASFCFCFLLTVGTIGNGSHITFFFVYAERTMFSITTVSFAAAVMSWTCTIWSRSE